jgi:beta-aspartyl-peptidase (threonine type)
VKRLGGSGGCIAVSRAGEVALPFNSKVMFRAWIGDDGEIRVAVKKGE